MSPSRGGGYPALPFAQFGELIRRNVIEDEGDPILGAFVHHAVVFLIVNLIRAADLEFVRPAIDHEAHTVIRRNRHVDAMTAMK